MKFISTLRTWVALVLAVLIVFYSFNFVPRYTNILATRSTTVKIFDWILNIAISLIVIYLVLTIIVFLYRVIFIKKDTK